MSRDPAAFGAIRKAPNLTAGLIETLVAQIESGDLAPGQRLPTEQAIVSATGVSRTVVREALASLRARGMITTRQGLGAFVAETALPRSFSIEPDKLESIADVLQVLELRLSIEVEAAGLAAERRDPAGLERIEAAQAAFLAAISAPGADAETVGLGEDLAVHRAILAATGNAYFARVFDVFNVVIPRQRIPVAALSQTERERHLRRVGQEHEAILAAIRAGDATAARRAMRVHLTRARDRYAALRSEVKAG
ncbi:MULTISPECIES: FadR/GntR family transcriptional regulator [Inquilinus]|uniref:DNA-binding FadR family transcriptional regulator n=1 Tax=Inquilinus ginsengisoli TaxID=363840 RepID=A0ABU1JTH0_9PROT|nr:FadR/GntR family transcriptional regulator [Inquilinus ginsengisoli]MDR6291582.1 DNA-binding FadR family transcriptional regulator [Inquilinus ginsengisoli]